MRSLVLKARAAKPLWAGHPWVHAGSVASLDPVDGQAEAITQDWVRVQDADGLVIGSALLSPRSALRARIVVWGDGPADEEVFEARIAKAAALRARLFPDAADTNAYRLVHAEGDGLPGLVVDRLGDVLTAQFATGPMWRRREALARSLLKATGARCAIARPAGHEAIEDIDFAPWHWPTEEPLPGEIEIIERGLRLRVDPVRGQKTGHYCDQRESRWAVAQLAAGRRVLDLYCGTGGFLLQAVRAGARQAVGVDASEDSVRRARETIRNLGFADRAQVLRGDVTEHLKQLRHEGSKYDLVILDPPNLLPRKGPDAQARKHFRELIVRALTRVEAGGHLAVFSCSPRIDAEGLLSLATSASRDCRVRLRLLASYGAGPDHPVLPVRDAATPRLGQYLAGHLLEVDPW